MSKFIIFILIIAALLSGCAKVKFYSGPDIKNEKETGLKFYSAKPYLLVARTGAKDKPIEVSVVYLPDLQNPQYAYYRAGMGSNKMSMALANSMLTSYGYDTDPKIAETLGALASLGTASGGVVKALAEAQKLRAEAAQVRAEASAEEIRRAADIVKEVAKDLRESVEIMGARLNMTAQGEAKAIATELDGIAAALEASTAPTRLDSIVQRLKAVLPEKRWEKLKHPGIGTDPIDFNARMDKNRKQLQEALNLLEPTEPPPATSFELYEIRQENGGTSLIQLHPK